MLPIRGLDPSNPSTNLVRSAATAFVRGTTLGWGKRELATWLVGHYAPCLEVEVPRLESSASGATTSGRVDEDQVEEVILQTRSVILKLLGDLAWSSHRARIADRAIHSGAIVLTGDGASVRWAPVGRSTMRLSDRVASLFLADALNHPDDYDAVALCRECGGLGFKGPIPHDVLCERETRAA